MGENYGAFQNKAIIGNPNALTVIFIIVEFLF